MKELQRNTGGRGIIVYVPEYDQQAYNDYLSGGTHKTFIWFWDIEQSQKR